jgi:hypothetical protein
MVVDFVVFNNIIYVLTNKAEIRVLSINFARGYPWMRVGLLTYVGVY